MNTTTNKAEKKTEYFIQWIKEINDKCNNGPPQEIIDNMIEEFKNKPELKINNVNIHMYLKNNNFQNYYEYELYILGKLLGQNKTRIDDELIPKIIPMYKKVCESTDKSFSNLFVLYKILKLLGANNEIAESFYSPNLDRKYSNSFWREICEKNNWEYLGMNNKWRG